MADKTESYKEMKSFVCVSCGVEVMATKFASQKTIQCEKCKLEKAPINQEIVNNALLKNPPKAKTKSQDISSDSPTKERPCIECGELTIVSKFMSDLKVKCDKCKGTTETTAVKGIAPRLTVDISKVDRSKLLPIEEYEVNESIIANKKLRSVECPACGHEYMKPMMIVDWSQFGLIINYQCPKCFLTAMISEQCKKMIPRYTPGRRFDYTGNEIKELGVSFVENSRMNNIFRIFTKKLEENNIKIEDEIVPPYRWINEKPVKTGFVIPSNDLWMHTISELIKVFDTATRVGSDIDEPEGCRNILISDTLAKQLSEKLKILLKGNDD